MRWIIRQRFADGRYSCRVFRDSGSPPVKWFQRLGRVVQSLLSLVVDISLGVLLRDRVQYPYAQNYFYERTFRHLQILGALYEQHYQLLQRSKVKHKEVAA